MKIDLETKKEVAKIAMTATLGATVVTSMFMKNKLSKNIHITAGVAFCGFALWHHLLYKPSKKTIKPLDDESTEEKELVSTN